MKDDFDIDEDLDAVPLRSDAKHRLEVRRRIEDRAMLKSLCEDLDMTVEEARFFGLLTNRDRVHLNH